MSEPTNSSTSPRFAVVTVSYGSEQVLGPFLESVASASTAPLAVVVADNRPEQGGQVQALTTQHGAHYLAMPHNLGYGGAMNAGVSSLPDSVEWVLLSNPDVVLTPGAIDALCAVGESDTAIAAIGPAILNEDGTLYPSARAVPSLRTGVGHAMFYNLWPSNPWSRRYLHEEHLPSGQRDAGWLSGSCLLVRRSAFDQIDGFDPAFFMYFEDVDLGYRFSKLGYRNVYEPSVSVMHSGAHATTSDSSTMIAVHHTSARTFLAKKYAGPLLWPVRASLTLGLTIRSTIIQRRILSQASATKKEEQQ